MIPIFDRRKDDAECSLGSLVPGQTFLWNEYLCVVVDTTGTSVQAKNDEHILCMALGSAQLVDIDKHATVTMCDCEINIVA